MFLTALVLAGAGACSPIATAEARPLEVDVWTSRGDDGVLFAGHPVDVYFETNKRARVIVYAIDVEGWVHILFPTRAWEDGQVRGGQTCRIPESRVDALTAESEGVVVIGAVASRKRLPVARWFERGELYVFREDYCWRVSEASPYRGVIGRVVGDPFEAVWAIEDALIPAETDGRDVASDLCWLSVDTESPRPHYIVIDGRRRWECDRRFHLVFNFGVGFDWPRSVIRKCVRRIHGRPFYGLPRVCEVRNRHEELKWKEKDRRNPQKKWNQTGSSCVLVSSSSERRLESRKKDEKSPPTSNKPASKGYSSRKGHKSSSKKGAALADHAGRHKKK